MNNLIKQGLKLVYVFPIGFRIHVAMSNLIKQGLKRYVVSPILHIYFSVAEKSNKTKIETDMKDSCTDIQVVAMSNSTKQGLKHVFMRVKAYVPDRCNE